MGRIRSIFNGLKCIIGRHEPYAVYNGSITGERGLMTYIVIHCTRCDAYLCTELDYDKWDDIIPG